MKKAVKKSTSKKTKIILVGIALVLCIASVLAIVLIYNSPPSLDEFTNSILEKKNFKMTTVISYFPYAGKTEQICEVDGNLQHILPSDSEVETYFETVGNTRYVYTKDGGKWYRYVSEDEDFFEALAQLLNPENYEPVLGEKNTYQQKSNVSFETFKDVKIIIDGNVLAIEMTTISDGMTFETLVMFSDVGKIHLTLPAVE
ncbi:MAG: hypothetical protein J6V22_06320 [Clostridia bacterium]|nr:hypothetical protein [Clostridia bacterium]